MSEQGLFQHMTASLTVSGANTASFYFPYPCQVIRVVAVVTTGVTVAPAILTGSIEQRDGTATDPAGTTELGTFTIPIAAVNLGFWKDITSRKILLPGERVDFVSNAGATAGAVDLSLIVQPIGFQDVPHNRKSTDAGAADVANLVGYLTEVTA